MIPGLLLFYKKMALDGKEEEVERARPMIKRSLFIVGLLLRFFDFTDKEVLESISVRNCYYYLIFVVE